MAKKILITDVTLRDAHQSLIATRMTTEEMLPILEKMDKVGSVSYTHLWWWESTMLILGGSCGARKRRLPPRSGKIKIKRPAWIRAFYFTSSYPRRPLLDGISEPQLCC